MRKPLILVVDDDQMVREFVILSLGRNFEFIESFDGESTLELLDKHQPDLVIQDLNLPDMDGLDLNRMILAHYPEVPIIAFTGYTLKLGGDYRGFVGYVLKPIVPDNLLSVVDHFIDWENIKSSQQN